MEADGDIDNKGKDEAAKSLPMRRLREIDEMGKGDCSIEVVERQKRMKETDADPDDKEMEVVVSEDEELSDFDEEEAKRWYEEEYLVFKRNQEQELVQECLREPDRLQDRLAYQAKMYRENWNPRYGSFDKKKSIFNTDRPYSIGQSVLLLETANDQVPLSGDEIILARQVVSVESHGKLNVLGSISNSQVVYTDSKDFKPLKMGTSTDYLHLGCNTLGVTIFWSCFEF
nr:unnamed protein product [Digitaria exilis]